MKRRLLTGCIALACIPLGMAYTHYLRLWVLKRPWVEREGVVNGEVICWKHNLRCLSEAFGSHWTGHPFAPAYSHTQHEIWPAIASMLITLIACAGMPNAWGWHKVRVCLFFSAWWFVCLYATVITELRAAYCIAPLVIFCLLQTQTHALNNTLKKHGK